MNNKLYNELLSLRNNLQIVNRQKICDDEVLNHLVKYKPTNKDDMLKISGIGPTFIDNYSDKFIKIIKKYIDVKECNINENEKTILQKLENRLVDINQRNRLLYSSKINKDYSIDLSLAYEVFQTSVLNISFLVSQIFSLEKLLKFVSGILQALFKFFITLSKYDISFFS